MTTDPALRALAENLLDALDAHDEANVHGWSVALRKALAAEAAPLDSPTLGMAMDMVDEDDAVLGVVGRGTKAERVITRYAQLMRLTAP